MNVITKPFFESKIMIGATVVFIASVVQAFTSFFLPAEVLDTVTDTLLPAIQQKTLLAVVSAAASAYMLISRSYLKSTDIVKVWYKSGILWAAIITFLAQVAFFKTGITIPAELTDSAVALILELINTGDVIAFLAGGLQIGLAIWRIFSTDTEIEFTDIKPLKPALTLYSHKQAA